MLHCQLKIFYSNLHADLYNQNLVASPKCLRQDYSYMYEDSFILFFCFTVHIIIL